MTELESSQHLYQRPRYAAGAGGWFEDYADALRHGDGGLDWDLGAIMSILSFNYVCGDRTLLRGVRRNPWLAAIDADGSARLTAIPPHGYRYVNPPQAARRLAELLRSEIVTVCQGRSEICLLLSGGLDSRIVACVAAQAAAAGELAGRLTALTWGLPDSRDVVYARAVAERLGIEWTQVAVGPDDLQENLGLTAESLGCLVPALHLHKLSALQRLAPGTLVIASSYGDSVGRAEFAGNHLLELGPLRPMNFRALLRPEVAVAAGRSLQSDFAALRERTPGQPEHVLCEHEMQGHYMRSMIAHCMSIGNRYCTVYQAFTDPAVYSYMWRIHPALRTDRVYAELLEQLDTGLARLPWARNNRALRGSTMGARPGLRRQFHRYDKWINGPWRPGLAEALDADWFAETGIFDAAAVKKLGEDLQGGLRDFHSVEILVWLVCFRRFAEWVGDMGKRVGVDAESLQESRGRRPRPVAVQQAGRVRRWLRSWPFLLRTVRSWRRLLLRRRALRRFPAVRRP
jgi:asparagine synthase (glutamine-hydrolysing)